MAQTTFGAFPSSSGVKFSVWAPEAKVVELVLFKDANTENKRIALQKDDKGIFHGDVKVHYSKYFIFLIITQKSSHTRKLINRRHQQELFINIQLMERGHSQTLRQDSNLMESMDHHK